MYDDYAYEIRRLQVYLIRLHEGKNLSEVELIEKEMVEAWTALVRRYRVTSVGD